jgi:hypothetical protein
MNIDVQQSLEKLDQLRNTHFHLLNELLSTDIKIQKFEFFTVSVLNRSFSLFAAFSDLIKAKNILAALPLVRLQIDNCLRLSA